MNRENPGRSNSSLFWILLGSSLMLASGLVYWYWFHRPSRKSPLVEIDASLFLSQVNLAQSLHRERTGRFGSLSELISIDRELESVPRKLGYELYVFTNADYTDWIALLLPNRKSPMQCLLNRSAARRYETDQVERIRESLPRLDLILVEGDFKNEVHQIWKSR